MCPLTSCRKKPYPYAGENCHGVNLIVTARNEFDATAVGIEIVAVLHKQYPDKFEIQGLNRLLANKSVLASVSAGRDPQRIQEEWQDSLRRFEMDRKQYLLY